MIETTQCVIIDWCDMVIWRVENDIIFSSKVLVIEDVFDVIRMVDVSEVVNK
jgi:hypothetical protein